MEGEIEIRDIALELNKLYSNAKEKKDPKRGEKTKIFLSILKRLFLSYGSILGYEDLSSFKSDVVRAKNNLKRKKTGSKLFKPSEGDGEIFTFWQIEEFGLNPDSYI